MSWHDLTFDAMGCEVRILVGDPLPGSAPADEAADRGMRFIHGFDAALSRFREDSELTALNSDDRELVPASPLLRQAVGAGLWAAEQSGGLVDPTLAGAIASVGYKTSRRGVAPASLAEALAEAPARHPARPNPGAEWRRFELDEQAGTIRRPPGVGFDTGGSGKGLAADMVADQLRGYSQFVVDCGGDVRVGGFASQFDPFAINVQHPIDGEPTCILYVGAGGVATSGLNVRLWRRKDGSFAHHLLDPSTGQPAWTGLVGVTAVGASALEAETLSKQALLLGPEMGRELLRQKGGLLVHEDGATELVGPLSAKLIGRRSSDVALQAAVLAGAAAAGGRP
jgi:thiamine biosynthesis lipoprotein